MSPMGSSMSEYRTRLDRRDGRGVVISLGQLKYSRSPAIRFGPCSRSQRIRRSPSLRICQKGARIATEYPNITERYMRAHGVEAEILLSYGATEAKIP